MKRLRLLIYDYDMPDEKARETIRKYGTNEIRGRVQHGQITIQAIELNPFKITIMELLRLFYREGSRRL